MYTGYEIADNYKRTALTKTTAKWYRTLILAIFAGAFIAFAGALATIAGTADDGTKSTLIKAAVFPVGLILVVLTGSELFTGNCLLIAPLLSRDVKLAPTLKNLSIVYAGNLVGSVVVALLTVYSGAFDGIQMRTGLRNGYASRNSMQCACMLCRVVFVRREIDRGQDYRRIPAHIRICSAGNGTQRGEYVLSCGRIAVFGEIRNSGARLERRKRPALQSASRHTRQYYRRHGVDCPTAVACFLPQKRAEQKGGDKCGRRQIDALRLT